MKKGSIVASEDIAFMRAETIGLAPDKIETVVGKKLLKDLKAFETILEDNIL